jgi:hypothetical protein
MDCAALDNMNQVLKRKCCTVVSKQNMDCAALDNLNQVSGSKKNVCYSCQQTKYGLCST